MLLSALMLSLTVQGAEPAAVAHDVAPMESGRLSMVPVASAPARTSNLSPERLETLREAVEAEPRSREHRFEHIRALIDAGELEDALAAAKAWRNVDAYNLVVVRLIGDILTELDRPEEALRVYSAVTELLPEDPEAQRALATVLKQQGDLQAAQVRLTAARTLRPDDARLRFELADVSLRLGQTDQALTHFETIAEGDGPKALRYPAKQRLAQIYAQKRRQARAVSDTAEVEQLDDKIKGLGVKGGADNDIKVYLSWDTDRTDVDLWVINPSGEKVYYQNKRGRHGGALFDDVTTGYGPESFTAPKARVGTYTVKVNYYGTSRGSFKEARGEVIVVLNEGRDNEVQHTFAYRLHKPKQTVTVAKIKVEAK